MPRPAALFDSDRTLVTCNTGRLLVAELRRAGRISRGFQLRSLGWLLKYRLGLIDMADTGARAAALTRGHSETEFASFCRKLCEQSVFDRISPHATERLDWHRSQGHFIGIISTSPVHMVRPVAEQLGIDTFACTEMVVENGVFTGALAGPVCWGKHKKDHAEALAQRHDLDLAASWFYSDSLTDLPLLEHVGNPIAINPDRRLARIARSKKWPIELWPSFPPGSNKTRP